jgi:hypothetical protein
MFAMHVGNPFTTEARYIFKKPHVKAESQVLNGNLGARHGMPPSWTPIARNVSNVMLPVKPRTKVRHELSKLDGI